MTTIQVHTAAILKFRLICYSAVLTVSWAQPEYVVGEGDGLVMTCLELIGAMAPTQAEIWVTLSASEDLPVVTSGKLAKVSRWC